MIGFNIFIDEIILSIQETILLYGQLIDISR
jgi:hypothetical protein